MERMRTVPWNVSEMTLEQAETEYERMRNRSHPSTADLRRETDLYWHIHRLRYEGARGERMRPVEMRHASAS